MTNNLGKIKVSRAYKKLDTPFAAFLVNNQILKKHKTCLHTA
jgi:hypothetical protein